MNRKYAIHGIIGCVLFGIGDWLLGYVDPGEVTGDVFYNILARKPLPTKSVVG